MQNQDDRRSRWDLEHWLRSPARRIALAAAILLVAALGTTAQLNELRSFRGRGGGGGGSRPVDLQELLTGQLAYWFAWGVAGFLFYWIARWMFARVRSWMIFVALQLPLSLTVAVGFSALQGSLMSSVFPRGRSESSFVENIRRAWPRRLPRDFLIYWVLLGVGAAARTFLQNRDQERRSSELGLRAAQLEAQLAHAQVDSLSSQLNPHFLFNALHTVGGLVRGGDSDAALRTLSSIGALLRKTLDHGESQLVPLGEELAIAANYLDIERIRFGDRLQVSQQVENGSAKALVPALLLLPLVENAVRHAIEPRPEPGRLTIDCRREGAGLRIDVSDDGPGFPEEVVRMQGAARVGDRAHIGLANTRERLEVLYGGTHEMLLENPSGGGARVSLFIPRPPESPESA